jgi:hypothetical protein
VFCFFCSFVFVSFSWFFSILFLKLTWPHRSKFPIQPDRAFVSSSSSDSFFFNSRVPDAFV